MKLLIGIHLHEKYKGWRFRRFVRKSFAQGQKTALMVFDWAPFSKNEIRVLSKRSRVHLSNFFLVRTIPQPGVSFEVDFGAYRKNFGKAIDAISKKLGKNEKIEPVFFGGSEETCFDRIRTGATADLRKKFGGRLGEIKTETRWVYRLPSPKTLKKQRSLFVGTGQRLKKIQNFFRLRKTPKR